MKKIFYFFVSILFIFSLVACSKVEETSSKPPFDYLRAFGGASNEENSRVFPLKDGTFYVVASTDSPAKSGDIPSSMHLSNDILKNISEKTSSSLGDEASDIWLFQIDPSKPYKDQIIYSRCFGGTAREELWTACVDENENVVICTKSCSNDGDVKTDNNRTCWIFRVDTKKPYNEQITYSQTFPQSYMWIPLDIKPIGKDTYYLLYNGEKNGGRLCSLMKLDFSKDVKQNPVFDREIFVHTSTDDMRSWFVSPHIAVSDKGILTMVWAVERNKLFSPFEKDKPLNIDKTINYIEEEIKPEERNALDILVISLNPKLSEKDWIVYSRIIGGSKCDIFPRILKAENDSFWISFFSASDNGDMKNNVVNQATSSLAIMKINPKLTKNKQIEYSKFIHADKSFITSAPFTNCDKNIVFFFTIKPSNDKNKIKDINLTDNQKMDNIFFPFVDIKGEYDRFGYSKLFILDPEREKHYFQDLKIPLNGGGLLNPNIAFADSSLFFAMDSSTPSGIGDMPFYKRAFMEELFNKGILKDIFSKDSIASPTFSSEIVVGKIKLENMKEFSNSEK